MKISSYIPRIVVCKASLLLLLLFAKGVLLYGQLQFKQKNIVFITDTILLDSVSLAPFSFSLRNEAGLSIPDSLYWLDYANGLLISPSLRGDKLQVSYLAYPVLFTQKYQHKIPRDYLTGDTIYSQPNPFFVPPSTGLQSQGIFSSTELEHSGSLMRGFNVSNNADASMTASFNLQLSGKITDELSLQANISDNNLPALPEGNTASLEEFDKISIRIYSKQFDLTAGDIEPVEKRDFFGSYQRKIMGASFSYKKDEDSRSMKSTISAGVSKGKFMRQQITVVEGNQGPYLLSGESGLRNIVLLSNSERVYIDGVLQERGAEAAYTMNYATGEITFTPQCMMNQNLRVVIEYEYTEQSYTRYFSSLQNELKVGKVDAYINAFYEGDAKSQPIDRDLSDGERRAMAQAGAQYWNVYTQTIDSVPYSNNELLYAKKDTLVEGEFISIYEYSVNPQEAHFRLRFTHVGDANGDYDLQRSIANGRVYVWVGRGRGSYQAAQLLVTPKQKLMLTAGATLEIDSLSEASLELGLTSSSNNLFAVPKSQQAGLGLNASIHKGFQLTPKQQLGFGVKVLAVGQDFSTPEPYLSPEFERDWNILGGAAQRNLQTYTLLGDYTFAKHVKLNTSASILRVGTLSPQHTIGDTVFAAMQGESFAAGLGLNHNRFEGNVEGSFLQTRESLRQTQFARSNAELTQGIAWFTLGALHLMEYNLQEHNNELLPKAYFFHSESIFLRLDSTRLPTTLTANLRDDYRAKHNVMHKYTNARELSLSSTASIKQTHNTLSLAFRQLNYVDSARTEHILLLRDVFSGAFAQGALQSSVMYELGAGAEPKQDYMYIEVGTGQGVYAWRDYNNNGVRELDEFEIAAFADEASYIRIVLPSDDYVQTYSGKFALQLSLNPSLIWRQHKGTKGFLSRWSNHLSLSNEHKNLRRNFAQNANPFLQIALTDTSLIRQNLSALNTLGYLTASGRTKLELMWQSTLSKQLLANGFESQQSTIWRTMARHRLLPELQLIASIEQGQKTQMAQYTMLDKNFNIQHYTLLTEAQCTPTNLWRINAKYTFTNKNNKLAIERAQLHNANIEANYNIKKKGVLSANLGFTATSFNVDNTATSLAYQMLEGFSKGNNITFGGNFRRIIANGLEISLSYAGRKLSTNKVIHTGTADLRLLF
ncbi:MAG: hypothetical protein ACRCY6_04440 [Bacteroidales bacterium]